MGQRYLKASHDTPGDTVFPSGWRVVCRSWDDSESTETPLLFTLMYESGLLAAIPSMTEETVAYLATEDLADVLLQALTGREPLFDEGVWY